MIKSNCPFCRIAAGTVPAEIVSEDGELVAFRDRNPVAPTHILCTSTCSAAGE